ncbi:MAG: histidine phosphatase family protein [Reichenbachiella sp.]|uniref:histidine phosphatase family protein n=1 Tax=Reichenbachiella sp. TaxID=2184521 RepID=UPI003266D0C8
MKTKNIYIIRHGQTDYNLEQKVQGRGIDSSINPTGRIQASHFYDAYQHVPFDKIYHSELKRTSQSVHKFIEKGIPRESLSGLDEISWGKHEGQEFDPEMHKIYLDTVANWERGRLDIAVGGGESPLEVMHRQKTAIEYIMNQTDESHVLVATHGRAMRILMCWMLNYPMQHMDAFEHTNLCLYQLEYSGHGYRVIKHGSAEHLNDIKI